MNAGVASTWQRCGSDARGDHARNHARYRGPQAPPRAWDSDFSYAPDRATRRTREPPSDAEIERGLRERAVSDPRAAEILLRWLQRVRPPEATPGVDLDAMSEAQLERLHAGLVRLASMDETVLAALVEQVLPGDEAVSSS
jgi:hypothetical protein